MKLLKSGKSISKPEVTSISEFGLWLFFNEREYFLDFEKFPWFKDAKLSDILCVEVLGKYGFRWPTLDVELELDSIKSPEQFPMVYKE